MLEASGMYSMISTNRLSLYINNINYHGELSWDDTFQSSFSAIEQKSIQKQDQSLIWTP
jgi:hypothetical protein